MRRNRSLCCRDVQTGTSPSRRWGTTPRPQPWTCSQSAEQKGDHAGKVQGGSWQTSPPWCAQGQRGQRSVRGSARSHSVMKMAPHLWDFPPPNPTPEQSQEQQTSLNGGLYCKIPDCPQNCQGHRKHSRRNYDSHKEPKETWGLNVMQHPGRDLGWEGGHCRRSKECMLFN